METKKCPKCNSDLKHIKAKPISFDGCSNYPTCKYRKYKNLNRLCPECNSNIIIKLNRKQIPYKRFFGCSNYPTCKYSENFPLKSKEKNKIYKKIERLLLFLIVFYFFMLY